MMPELSSGVSEISLEKREHPGGCAQAVGQEQPGWATITRQGTGVGVLRQRPV